MMATFVPVFGAPKIPKNDNICYNELSTNEINHFENNKKIENIYFKIINDLANGTIDLKDMNLLYSNPNIYQNIKDLSNKETITLLDSIFKSENYYKIKFLSNKLEHKISEEINDDSFSFYNTFFDKFFSEIKCVDDLKDSKYLSELNLEIKDIYQMKIDLDLYLSDETAFNNIIKNLDIDEETLFLIFFVLWVFIYGACATTYPDIFPIFVMLIESVAIGVVGSFLIGTIFENDDHPFLAAIYNFFINSNILKKVPAIQDILLNSVNWTIKQIETKNAYFIAAIGWAFGNIALGTFMYLYSSAILFKLVTSGIWFILPSIGLIISRL